MASLKEENVELRASSAAAGAEEGGTCVRIAGFAAWLQAAQDELHGVRAARKATNAGRNVLALWRCGKPKARCRRRKRLGRR
jgi:hypothetical protein